MVGGCLGKYVVDFQPSTFLTAEARVQFQTSPCGICGLQSGTGPSFSPSASVSPVSIISPMFHTLPCQYHSTNVPHTPLSVSFHQCSTLSPVSIIPPMFHTLPCQYHSTNVSHSPLSVSFHQCSTVSPVSIIPPMFHTLPCQYHSTNVPHSPLSVSFHQCSTLVRLSLQLCNLSVVQQHISKCPHVIPI